MKHYRIGGSTAKRTINCPAWLKLTENRPKQGSNKASRQGSMHHEVQEACRNEDILPEDVLKRGFSYEEDGVVVDFTNADLTDSNIAYNVLETVLDEYDIEDYRIEPFVEIVPNQVGGSIDYLGLSADGKTVLVADYKFGRRAVDVVKNPQLMFYAIAAMTDPLTKEFFAKATKVALCVIQPAVSPVKFIYETDMEELAQFKKTLDAAIKETGVENPTVKAGTHCAFCANRPYCAPAKQQVVAAKLLDPKDQNALKEALDLVEVVTTWAKEVSEEAQKQMERGVPIDGWKLIKPKGQRAWEDEAAAQKKLMTLLPKKELFKVTEKFITGPQAVDLIKAKQKAGQVPDTFDIDEYITFKESKGYKMVPADTKGEAVVIGDVPDNLKNL